MTTFLKKYTQLTVKISKSIRLITPVLSPPLGGSDRKTVEQKIMYAFALVMCPGLEPDLPSGRYTALPSPALKWGMGTPYPG